MQTFLIKNFYKTIPDMYCNISEMKFSDKYVTVHLDDDNKNYYGFFHLYINDIDELYFSFDLNKNHEFYLPEPNFYLSKTDKNNFLQHIKNINAYCVTHSKCNGNSIVVIDECRGLYGK